MKVEPARWLSCSRSPEFFLDTYGQIYDATARAWIRFRLWPAQAAALRTLAEERLVVVLKARQLGMSWLATGYALWLLLFRPAATVLFFSRRDDEAVHLLTFRLRGMYDRLPRWMQARAVARQNAHALELSNGSTALAFPTTGGRSYTATLAVVDEADYTGDLDALLNAVKPTIDAGGRLILLSTADKSQPESAFKRIYRAAAAGENGYAAVFLPWHACAGRDATWYEAQARDVEARTGGLDDLHQEYPATDLEALAPRAVDKFFPAAWLAQCWRDPIDLEAGAQTAVPGLTVHSLAVAGESYVIGADPAEGNPSSDESAAVVLGVTGEQVATLAGRFDPATFAARLDLLAGTYGDASVLVERNNHGHAVLLWLAENGTARVLNGSDGRPGWPTTGASKPLAFDAAAEALRDCGAQVRDRETWLQLAAIDGSRLRAPPGQHDDRATAFVLALAALRWSAGRAQATQRVLAPADPADARDTGGW